MQEQNQRELLRLLRLAREESLNEYDAQLLEDTSLCLSFERAQALAFNPSAATPQEKTHLNTCKRCAKRIESFKLYDHPSFMSLVRYALDALPVEDYGVLRKHLKTECRQCQCVLQSSLVKTLKAAVHSGRRTLEYLATWLPHALHGTTQFPLPSMRFETDDSSREQFYSTLEQAGMIILIEETDDGEALFLSVATKDEKLASCYAHLEIIGEHKTLEASMPLKQEGEYYIGRRYFEGADDLITSLGTATVLAVTTDDSLLGGD